MKSAKELYDEFMEMAPEIANDWDNEQREWGCPEDVITHDDYWGDRFKGYVERVYGFTLDESIIRRYFRAWSEPDHRDRCQEDDYDPNEWFEGCGWNPGSYGY